VGAAQPYALSSVSPVRCERRRSASSIAMLVAPSAAGDTSNRAPAVALDALVALA